MSCVVTVTSIRGEEAASPATGLGRLIIAGTAGGCSRVCLVIQQTLHSRRGFTVEKCGNVDPASRAWEIQFDLPADLAPNPDGSLARFVCGSENKMTIEARCGDDGSQCNVTKTVPLTTIQCGDCPAVVFDESDVSVAGSCNADGTRTVQFGGRIGGLDGSPVFAVLSISQAGELVQNLPSFVVSEGSGNSEVISRSLDLPPGDYEATVLVEFPEGCTGPTVEFNVPKCPGGDEPRPPDRSCPVTLLDLVVLDGAGTDLTAQLRRAGCLPPGVYKIRANITPGNATSQFLWSVDGAAAAPGVRGVTAVSGRELTIDLATFRSISVIAAGCASDGIDIEVCEVPCCPNLTSLSASCMSRCPPSTSVVFTAAGDRLQCAEVFSWEFGDGQTVETTAPTVSHTYAVQGTFDASVTIVRPEACGPPRVQTAQTRVGVCPPSCLCVFYAIASAFLLLALLILMPVLAIVPSSASIVTPALVVVAALLGIAMFMWFWDVCCRPSRCEFARIMYWVFSWALFGLGLLAFAGIPIPPLLPFGLIYLIIQQVFQDIINRNNCQPGAPAIWDWPFPECR